MAKVAIVTGATSGIGRATALALAKEGWNLILTGRRAKKLIELEKEIQNLTGGGIKILNLDFDVRDQEKVDQYFNNLPQEWDEISLLVNNAGLAVGLNPIQDGILDDWERMIDTNIKGLLYVSRIIAKKMVSKGHGHIINIGSVAGKEVYPAGNVYCATKHAVDALTKGMRVDLLQYGIKVSQISPGAVETEFSQVRFKGDNERAANVYKGFEPLTSEDVANAILWIVNLPDHVNINDMVIMPKAQANASTTYKVPLA